MSQDDKNNTENGMQMSTLPSNDNNNAKRTTDLESSQEKLPYPKSVFFIVSNEFCERFSYYGMKAILTLYFTNAFEWDDDLATVVYHVFSSLCYFTPLLGAMIADSVLGKFRTIFYLSVVYCLGNIVLSLAATPPINIPQIPFSLLGLALIALGTGGIKPCVAAFGGDQFILPQQSQQLESFFFLFYFAINSGSLISTIVTPIMRDDVKCFGGDCFTLAFSVPAALMITALAIFLFGKPLYRVTKPTGNVVLKVIKCISCALGQKRKASKSRGHWLDHAETKYEKRFIEDVKILLRVLVLYIPLPVFWALFDQQGSRWTLQATRMNGRVTEDWTIKPDQVQVLNPALILIFIPIFDRVVYPLLGKCRLLRKPLQRLTVGGILAGMAFVASGLLELELEKTYPVQLASNEASINLVNTFKCPVTFKDIENGQTISIGARSNIHLQQITAGVYNLQKTSENCDGVEIPESLTFNTTAGQGLTYMLVESTDGTTLVAADPDDREKPKKGNPKIRFLAYGPMFNDSEYNEWRFELHAKFGKAEFDPVPIQGIANGFVTKMDETEDPHKYELRLVTVRNTTTISKSVTVKEINLGTADLRLGGGYIYTITQKDMHKTTLDGATSDDFIVIESTITEPNSLHLFWLLPQYFIITGGEVMFSITGLEFSYSQAPVTMKSVMQSAWLLTVAIGNLIVVIVAEAKFFQEQSKEFFLFAGLMFVDMLLFAFMAYRYVPAKLEDPGVQKKADEAAVNDNKGFDD